MQMEIKIPVELPDNWYDKVAEKLIEKGDAVFVTRCKDCKYYQLKNSLGTQGICACGEKDMNYSGEFYPYENDFCSYAEQKEIEGE
jgi:hypothetical protein